MPRLASLPMLTLILVLPSMNFMLLQLFSASGECCVGRTTCIPSAANGEDIEDMPLVLVTPREITVDGVYAGSPDWVMDGNPAPLNELRQILRNKIQLSKVVRPGSSLPDRVLFEIHRDLPAGVVKAVVAAAASVGLKPSFMVQKIETPLR